VAIMCRVMGWIACNATDGAQAGPCSDGAHPTPMPTFGGATGQGIWLGVDSIPMASWYSV